ncbi:MAG: hypothetical protein KAS39_04845 [Actinomycetia bacterium]|nr:hypothetical protein [Actinomycetes bacterium]
MTNTEMEIRINLIGYSVKSFRIANPDTVQIVHDDILYDILLRNGEMYIRATDKGRHFTRHRLTVQPESSNVIRISTRKD